ncbi:MAG: FHA domain-containing protein [Deltaproteobacteria bacterium]|jgi:hypothetical protein|nr:FHA domain-containing protein [Deltaproteobacteria bacterium]
MTSNKQCPVCGLIQPVALDCASCGSSLVNVKILENISTEKSADKIIYKDQKDQIFEEENSSSEKLNATRTNESKLKFQISSGCYIEVKNGDILGRDAIGAEYLSKYPKVSRKHAKIIFENNQWIIEDLDSSNGIFIEGVRTKRAVLTLGTEISLSTSCELIVVDY